MEGKRTRAYEVMLFLWILTSSLLSRDYPGDRFGDAGAEGSLPQPPRKRNDCSGM